jgi:hypothetical protein
MLEIPDIGGAQLSTLFLVIIFLLKHIILIITKYNTY